MAHDQQVGDHTGCADGRGRHKKFVGSHFVKKCSKGYEMSGKRDESQTWNGREERSRWNPIPPLFTLAVVKEPANAEKHADAKEKEDAQIHPHVSPLRRFPC
jgi:hypothetical protein